MPHKRNPIITERVAGMARLLRGNAIAALENVALWHERDISHSSVERVIMPDSTMLLGYMLEKLTWVMANLVVDRKRMRRNLDATGGLVFSQHILLALIEGGLSREDAYAVVQDAAMESMKGGPGFRERLLADPRLLEACDPAGIEAVFDVETHLERIDFIFRRVLGSGGRKRAKRN